MNVTVESTGNKWAGGNRPDEIVIHWWGDPTQHPTLDGVVNWFKNPSSQVSAHYVVSEDQVVKMMDEIDRAWHAVTANSHSIGIEIDPNFPGNTYRTVGSLVRDIRARWGHLPLIRHHDVPGTSTGCPGATNLDLIERYAQGESMAQILPLGREYLNQQFMRYYGRPATAEDVAVHSKLNEGIYQDGRFLGPTQAFLDGFANGTEFVGKRAQVSDSAATVAKKLEAARMAAKALTDALS